MVSDSLISRNIFTVTIPIISYSKINVLFFLHLTPLRHNIFPTSYPISENEFGHTVFRPLLGPAGSQQPHVGIAKFLPVPDHGPGAGPLDSKFTTLMSIYAYVPHILPQDLGAL